MIRSTKPIVPEKHTLTPVIREASTSYKRFKQFEPILRLLEAVEPIDPEAVPADSLPREFIGGQVLEH